jgi:hypothetical protein
MNSVFIHNGNPYQLVRRVSKSNFSKNKNIDMEWANRFKESIGCSHLFEDTLYFYFCEVIHEVEFEDLAS